MNPLKDWSILNATVRARQAAFRFGSIAALHGQRRGADAANAPICPETQRTEQVSVLGAAWWTLLLALPVHLFSTNPAFVGMARFPEHRWMLVTGSVALAQLVACLTHRPVWRLAALALGVFVYGAICTSLAATSPYWHGLPISPGFGMYAALAFVNSLAMSDLWPYIIADLLAVVERRSSRMNRSSNANNAK